MKTSFLRQELAASVPPARSRRALSVVNDPLDDIARRSPSLVRKPLAEFACNGQFYSLPRYIYLGPQGGETFRLGIFAGIHGDEPAGSLAIAKFVEALEARPEIAKGYALMLYPICNPTGFEDGTRHARHGGDLNREFWNRSQRPEVRLLESELCLHAFHGIITLHSDDTSSGQYGFVGRDVLSEFILEPAMASAERFLPRNQDAVIDGFPACNGIINRCYPGVLQAVPGVTPRPFEITFETPQKAPLDLQIEACSAALQTVLTEYRQFMAYAQNL